MSRRRSQAASEQIKIKSNTMTMNCLRQTRLKRIMKHRSTNLRASRTRVTHLTTRRSKSRIMKIVFSNPVPLSQLNLTPLSSQWKLSPPRRQALSGKPTLAKAEIKSKLRLKPIFKRKLLDRSSRKNTKRSSKKYNKRWGTFRID